MVRAASQFFESLLVDLSSSALMVTGFLSYRMISARGLGAVTAAWVEGCATDDSVKEGRLVVGSLLVSRTFVGLRRMIVLSSAAVNCDGGGGAAPDPIPRCDDKVACRG